ncbi:hypothetical protein G6011_01756 [Alternaria panax]|uniref:Uncharacterized protein n=1 Tax=Alternaria panax TaxID=48097 RepID=A0AAD4IL38_9PLEO|nr:hypothetical protein G6011_01756 [Alternaria panax]
MLCSSSAAVSPRYAQSGFPSPEQQDSYGSETSTESERTAESAETVSRTELCVIHGRTLHTPPSIADNISEHVSQDESYGHISIKQESEDDVESVEENFKPARSAGKRARMMEDQRLLLRKRRREEEKKRRREEEKKRRREEEKKRRREEEKKRRREEEKKRGA